MKILHAADLHQGILTHSRPDPATGIPSRILDLADAWRKVVDVALDENVDAVILAGDVFHTASPDATTLALFAEHLRRLRTESNARVVIIPGNHDRAPHSGRRTVLEVFDGGAVRVVTRPEVVTYGELRIACLPSVSRAELAAFGNVLRPEADEGVVDTLRAMIGDLAQRGADVLTLHTSIAGGILGTEKDLAIIAEPMLSPADLAGPWRYVAAGHIHREQMLDSPDNDSPVIRYAGSVAPLTFGEEGEHGVVIVDLDTSPPTLTFRTIDSRPLFSIEWSEASAPGWSGIDRDPEGAIVRVRGVPPELVDNTRQAMEAGGAWIVKIEPERPPERPADVLADVEVPSTREALEAWLEPRVPDSDERQRIAELASEL